MEIITALLAVLLCVLAYFLFQYDERIARIRRYTDKLPGPKIYPFIGTTGPFIFLNRFERWNLGLEYLKRYNPLFRWWLGGVPMVSVCSPELVEAVLNNTQTIDKALTYKFLEPWLGTGLLTSTGQKWHSHRKLITPTFHFKILDSFVEVFSEKSDILADKLKREVGKEGFNVYPYISRCALDIICETAMGISVHAQEDTTSDYVASVYGISEAVTERFVRPYLHSNLIYSFSYYGRLQKRCLKILHAFSSKVIQGRKAMRGNVETGVSENEDILLGKKKRVAFLDMLLDASENGSSLTDEEIREEVDTFMFEGHDTTTAGLCWALFLLGLHPDIQDRAYEELHQIFQGSDRPVTMKDLNDMKYLERVIKETLRLYPSVPDVGRLLEKDFELDGHTLPAGINLDIPIHFVHRNPKYFPNPDKFDPDNFLPDRVANRHPYAYIPFSAGPRNCIGQKFAILEEKAMLSKILRNYSVRSVDKREDIKILFTLILRASAGINIVITPRQRAN